MAKLKDGIISSWHGIVDAEMKDGKFYAYAKTDEQVRDIIMELVRALETEIVVDKAILVGRYAKGCADEWDGIEVGIMSQDFEGIDPFDRISLVSELIVRFEVHHSVEVVGKFTPDEYAKGKHITLYGWDWDNGKVIYQRDTS